MTFFEALWNVLMFLGTPIMVMVYMMLIGFAGAVYIITEVSVVGDDRKEWPRLAIIIFSLFIYILLVAAFVVWGTTNTLGPLSWASAPQ